MNRITRRALLGTSGALAAGGALAACGSGFSGNPTTAPSSGASLSVGTEPITVLIGSSGTAETNAVTDACNSWGSSSGVKVTVIPASNLDQQAAQGFASGKPSDLIYTSTNDFQTWSKAGNLYAYASTLPNASDFYPSLVQAFTYNNVFSTAPKDFSTLQLVINTDLWTKAGLSDSDLPTTWDQLKTVATKLTQGKVVGLSMSPQIERVGVFLAQNGGGLTSADGKTATANSDANVAALDYVKTLLAAGCCKWSSDIGAGWGGEAFGKQLCAMTIEGNWITGAMSSDYASVKYQVAELPAGTQKGTLQFTNGWGIAAKSANIGGVVSLVEYLTTTDQQLSFAKAFGVMPSLKSAKDQWAQQNPTMVPFVNGADYAQNLPAAPGTAAVISDFDSKIPQLAKTDSKTMLDQVQSDLSAALGG